METRTFLLPLFSHFFSLKFFFSSFFFKGKAVLSWCLVQFGFSNRLDALDVYLSSLEKVINDCEREFRFKKKNLLNYPAWSKVLFSFSSSLVS